MFNYKFVSIRFYEELNDFLNQDKRKKPFIHKFIDRTSVKDLIESFGVPHTEVDMIIVNGKSVSFDYLINDKDDISVYPVFESFDVSEVQHLRPEPLRNPKFVCDVHLGKLAKNLRMFGIDTLYFNFISDVEIVNISLNERRTILTRDSELLKIKAVTHGYYIRNTDPLKQAGEVLKRFHLEKTLKCFSRCLECNTLLANVNKEIILDRIPQKVKESQSEYFICENCNKIFWKGTHYLNMLIKLKLISES
ncbi:MAG: Mut7-C ubiquitin/RNAse domain-containing protein [Ignavibacterium sp.]|nr:Mut7-C ubiquitin/RNAse domain-containing protein [Ignavibacterium sp.]